MTVQVLPDQSQLIPEADPLSFARQIALRQLTMAPRSRKELFDKMLTKGVPEQIATIVLDRLVEVGLVDDVAYAHMLVRSKTNSRSLAKRALRVELTKKGIDPEIQNSVLDCVTDDDEYEMATALVAKKIRNMRELPTEARFRRLTGLLARKGYPANITIRVVREAIAEFDALEIALD